jgi:hypothetical protein
MNTYARVNQGRWIADCLVPYCNDARELAVGQTSIVCAKGHGSTVVWPPEKDVVAISNELARRPDEAKRNWCPSEAPIHLLTGEPVDQTVEDLAAEWEAAQDAEAAQRTFANQIGAMIVGAGAVSLDDLGLMISEDGLLVPAPAPEDTATGTIILGG